MRRLKADLAAMMRDLTSKQIAMLDEHIAIHGLVKDTDGILHLSDDQGEGASWRRFNPAPPILLSAIR